MRRAALITDNTAKSPQLTRAMRNNVIAFTRWRLWLSQLFQRGCSLQRWARDVKARDRDETFCSSRDVIETSNQA